jgi:alpha-1,2-glucosyltransferase
MHGGFGNQEKGFSMVFRRTPWRFFVLLAVSLSSWLIVLVYIHAQHLQAHLVDEAVHVPQIQWFLQGKFVTHPWLAMIPGYHLLIAEIMWMLGLDSVYAMRVISAAFGLFAGYLFYCIRQTLGDSRAHWRAASFFFLPLLFPYYFLVYTDTLSLVLVLASLLAALKQRHLLALIAVAASMAVFQCHH